MFNNIKTEVLEEANQTDRLGGTGGLFETGLYDFEITKAYGEHSPSGALGLHLEFKTADGQTYRESLYVTNREGSPTYHRDGKDIPMMGLAIADAICQCAVGQQLNQLATQEKIIDIYDYDAKKELPTPKQVVMDLLGAPVTLAIEKVRENKSVKNDSTGKYDKINEERFVNNIKHVFHTETKLSVSEARAGKEEGEFHSKWLEKYEGVVSDRYKEQATTGRPAASRTSTASQPAGKSPFARK